MDDEPGTLFGGDFLTTKLLRADSLTRTFRARQLSANRSCAVTVFLTHDDAAHKREVMTRDVQSLLRIPSDHFPRVLDWDDEEPERASWLATELADGPLLSELLKREHHVEWAEAFAILEQICLGLDAAHRRGIVHCDLKPQRIYIERAPHGIFLIKILGFELAKWIRGTSWLDESEQGIGTPAWMAPEQLRRRNEVCPATDVWALGLIGFELLTGAHYLNDRRTHRGGVLDAVLHERLDPASVRAQELGVTHALPPGFDEWFSRCVARETAARYATAGDALLGLRASTAFNVLPPVWSVTVEGALPAEDQTFQAVMANLRGLVDGRHLCLRRAVSGSIVLIIEGSREAYDVVRSKFEAGQLDDLAGVRVVDVQLRGGGESAPLTLRPSDAEQPSSWGDVAPVTNLATDARPAPDRFRGGGVQIFISYVQADTKHCDRLLVHLATLRRQGVVREWYDRCVLPGSDYNAEIDKNMEASSLIVLLVSADFLASDYCYQREMQRAVLKARGGDARVVPVLVRPCDFTGAPFANLQTLPRNGRPVTNWRNRDEAWHDVVRGIRAAVEGSAAA